MWLAAWLVACSGDEKEPVVDADKDGAPAGVDCDDGDKSIFPSAEEVPYDGIDQDCADGDLVDVDGDGAVERQDCDDADPARYPGAPEVPYDGIDQDCERGDLVDVDEDDHPNGEDCDDDDPRIHPNAVDDVGDEVDSNCDGIDGVDEDLDGWAGVSSGGLDCNDEDPLTHPSADEIWYDDIDQNCDNGCDYDQDGDGTLHPSAMVVAGDACDSGGPPVDDCDDTDPMASTTLLVSSDPEANAPYVALGSTITATLTLGEPSASITVTDAAGVPVAGSSLSLGATIVFTPDAPLAEGTTFTAEVDWSCGPRTFDFTTVTTADAVSLRDRVWEADLTGGTFAAPPGIGGILAFVTSTMLVTVVNSRPDEIDLRIAEGAAGVQELCTPTQDFASLDYTNNPLFALTPADLPFVATGIPITLKNAVFDGIFLADGSAIVEANLTGELDTVPLVPLVGGGPPQAVCQMLAAVGPPCVACSDGSGNFCVNVVIEDIPTVEVVGGVIERRTDAIIAADVVNCP